MVYATDLTSFQRLTIMEIYHCAKIMISVIMQIKERKNKKNIENYLMILIKFLLEMVHNRKEDILSTL